MLNPMRTARPGRLPRLARTGMGALASLGLAAVMLGTNASPTMAFNTSQPNGYLAGYGVNVGANVTCDYANDRLFVSAEAMVMTPQGPSGPMAGPYDAGQFIRHNVFVREAGQAGWTLILSWSPWVWATSSIVQGDLTINRMADLGSDVITVTPGHDYEVLVQVDYWTGVSNVINVTPAYGEVHDASISSYVLQPGVCRM